MIDYLINLAKKTPYSHLSDYMRRYWIIPYRHERKIPFYKNPLYWLLQQFDIAIRVHEILRSDSGRAHHDHPWAYLTIILKGGYYEVTPNYDESGLYFGNTWKWHGPGSILFRRAKSQHRLELPTKRDSATTLFITFKKTQSWGFFPNPRFKTYYKDYPNREDQ